MASYFDETIEENLLMHRFPTKYDTIVFNNVLANLGEPINALRQAKKLLMDKKSIIGIQTGYHPIQFSKGLFDYIYHEHYSYFSIRSLSSLAFRAGLYIDSYAISNLRGGSIRFLLKQGESEKIEVRERFCNSTENKGLFKLIELSSEHLRETLSKLKSEGKKIIGYGASHSTGILVHQFELQNLLDGLVDENPNKQMKFMPGTSLKVENPTDYLKKPDICFVVLAWQYYEQIAEKLNKRGFEGIIIKPVLP